jgi:polyhydroxybutyrate depolymerase
MTRALLFLLVLLGALPAAAGEMRKVMVGGVERTYYLHVPEKVKGAAPLVIWLHGKTTDGGQNDVQSRGWEHVANHNGFIIAGPDAAALWPDQPMKGQNFRAWNQGGIQIASNISKSDDIGFISAMIDDIARTTAIDRRKVYAGGFSSGGGLAHRLGLELSTRIAAISASAAGLPPTFKKPARGISMLISAGDRDPVTPVEGRGSFVSDSHRVLVDKWRTLDDCPAPKKVPSKPELVIEASGPCRDGSEVRYILMRGTEHAWPTDHKPIDLTITSWEFFTRFSLPATAVQK